MTIADRSNVRTLQVTLAAAWLLAGAAQAEDSRALTLLHQYKCDLCHADREAKAGPAYVDVAAWYKGNPKAVTAVAAIVSKGEHGGGSWHMPPHPEVSNADAQAMARYILSVK